MKYLSEFRDKKIIEALSDKLKSRSYRQMQIMEVCGSQTHTIMKYNIEGLLPEAISLIHGPGCPVCVTSVEKIDKALRLAEDHRNIVLTYGDMIRVPGSEKSLAELKSEGADIRIIYSPLDAVEIARNEKEKNIILFAIGFETTAPVNASAVLTAKQKCLDNFFVLSAQVLIPPAVEFILSSGDLKLDGLLAPGHVCSVTGYSWCEEISGKYKIPVTVTGFEPSDILEGIFYTAESISDCKSHTINQYRRVVTRTGNSKAREIINKVFCKEGRIWRGLGYIPESGYKLNDEYSCFDAEKIFELKINNSDENSDCISGEILKGLKKPVDCTLFGNVCHPLHPAGAPMVSSEGACAAYFKYKNNIISGVTI